MKTKIIITIFSILLFSCSKSDDAKPELTNDCVAKNYGVVTVNYTNLSDRHAIDVTKIGSPSFNKSKITAVGFANDTIRLKPGRYQLSISRINNAEQALETHPETQSTISQCSTQIVNTQI